MRETDWKSELGAFALGVEGEGQQLGQRTKAVMEEVSYEADLLVENGSFGLCVSISIWEVFKEGYHLLALSFNNIARNV